MIKLLNELGNWHGKFLRDTYDFNKYSGHPITVLPSVIFLVSNFILMYSFCHRYTKIGITSFRTWLFRELTFQWSFFYLSKVWFIFMRLFKYSTKLICSETPGEERRISQKYCYLIGLSTLSFVSTVPIIVYYIKEQSLRNRFPNFLLWIGEDPWLRTEIGLSGHYLDRPPRFAIPTNANLAYRTKRSASIEAGKNKGIMIRKSKSVQCVKNNH